VGVRISGSTTITATGESALFNVPGDYVAFLRRLSITNRATATAIVRIIFYNGDAKKVVLTHAVPAGSTVVLREDQLPVEACPTRIAVDTNQQPIDVDWGVELE
jgi:hypothetical protein